VNELDRRDIFLGVCGCALGLGSPAARASGGMPGL
jgi:hypothetical protein